MTVPILPIPVVDWKSLTDSMHLSNAQYSSLVDELIEYFASDVVLIQVVNVVDDSEYSPVLAVFYKCIHQLFSRYRQIAVKMN